MPRRPEIVPRFATDPASSRIEIAEDTRQAGFLPNDRPPAEWLNWLFNTYGQWIDFLRGPSLANWSRVELADTGPVTPGLGIANLTADNTTLEPAAGPRRRVVFTEPAYFWTSKRGDSWKRQSKGNLTANIGFLCFSTAGTRWVVTSQDSKAWWSWPDDGTHTTSIGNAGNNWNASTLPGGVGTISGIAAGSDGVVIITDTQVLWSADGTSFAFQALSVAPAGGFLSVVYVPASTSTPAGWVAVTDAGELYRAPVTGTATWTKLGTTLPSSFDWRLECDDAGHVLAYRVDAGTAVAWYVSADGGQTWSSQTAPATVTTIKQVRWLDGLWLACAATPGVAVSNTLDATGWAAIRLPIQDGWSGFNPVMVCLSEGRYIAPVSDWAYVSLRAEDTSPGPWTPGTVPADLMDSAYLRGYPIAPTAPSVGDVPTWDGSSYVPSAGGGGGGGTSFSVTRTNTTGLTLAQGAPVYNSGGSSINLARANGGTTAVVLGLVAASTIAGATATLITHGVATIASAVQTGTWLDGQEIYLDDAAAGKLTNAAPTASGTYALPVGLCVGTPGGGNATLVVRVGGRITNP